MFEKLLKQWAKEQGFDVWSQDHAAVLRNLSKWLNMHAVEQPLALDTGCRCDLQDSPNAPADWHGENCPCYRPCQ